MEHRETIRTLFNNYLRGNYTPAELDIILAYFHVDAEAPYLRQLIEQELDTEPSDSAYAEAIAVVDAGARAYLAARIRQTATLSRFARYRLAIAASILALISIGISFYFYQAGNNNANLAAVKIAPGGNKAMLTLADGRVINLNSEQEGIVIQDGITYLDGTEIVANGKWLMENEGPAFNSITTPNGGTYRVTLPDGSKVWLNSASTLKYPSRFSEQERVVEIGGEVYFEIEKDTKRPFKIVSADQTVEVLGTEFNISAYADEAETKTTLVEGSVRLEANGASLQLVPGEQGISNGSTLTKTEVDTAPYTSWKGGVYVLDNGNLHQLIRQLERWYDVEFIIDQRIQKPVSGIIPRNANLSEVLRAIADNTGLTFTVSNSPTGGQGRRIMVAE